MANYDFYLAKSKSTASDPAQGRVGFHFRSSIIQDEEKNKPPFLILDTEQEDSISVSIETINDKTHYTVSVRLVEISSMASLPYENWVFYEKKPLDYDHLVGTISTFIKKPDDTVEVNESSDNLLYPDMPEEYPID